MRYNFFDEKLFIFLKGNLDEAIKLFTEAILKNPSASMYAKRARYLIDFYCLNLWLHFVRFLTIFSP